MVRWLVLVHSGPPLICSFIIHIPYHKWNYLTIPKVADGSTICPTEGKKAFEKKYPSKTPKLVKFE
jgi:hypothetical protein